jgi:hypothetical protein
MTDQDKKIIVEWRDWLHSKARWDGLVKKEKVFLNFNKVKRNKKNKHAKLSRRKNRP